MIIAADGGADNCIKIGIEPDHVIGDLDSISAKAKKKFSKKIIHDKSQDTTDLEKAINLTKKLKCTFLEIICATGLRMDHTLSNIICLLRVNFPSRIIDKDHDICIPLKKLELKGKKGDVISVIPISEVKGLTYSGLKWNIQNKDTETGWIGTSNEMISNKASISLKSGKIIVIKTKK